MDHLISAPCQMQDEFQSQAAHLRVNGIVGDYGFFRMYARGLLLDNIETSQPAPVEVMSSAVPLAVPAVSAGEQVAAASAGQQVAAASAGQQVAAASLRNLLQWRS